MVFFLCSEKRPVLQWQYYFVTILCVLMVNEFGVMKCKISIISKYNYEIAED